MGLIRLLKFARSLRSGTDSVPEYSMTQENLVPDFHRSGSRPDSIAEESIRAGRGRSDSRAPELPQQAVVQRPSGRWLAGSGDVRPSLKADSKGQLSLEFVKVLRNDLSDSDLELVPVKAERVPKPMSRPTSAGSRLVPATSATPVPVAAGAGVAGSESVEPEPSRWSRFTSRLFGSEQAG